MLKLEIDISNEEAYRCPSKRIGKVTSGIRGRIEHRINIKWWTHTSNTISDKIRTKRIEGIIIR